MLTHSPMAMKPLKLSRSAMEPVGMVAAVSHEPSERGRGQHADVGAHARQHEKPLSPSAPLAVEDDAAVQHAAPVAQRHRRKGPCPRLLVSGIGVVDHAELQGETHQPVPQRPRRRPSCSSSWWGRHSCAGEPGFDQRKPWACMKKTRKPASMTQSIPGSWWCPGWWRRRRPGLCRPGPGPGWQRKNQQPDKQ